MSDTIALKTDTLFNCVTHTYFNDNVTTSTNISGLPVYCTAGVFEDSFFGNTNASLYFQVIPSTAGITFDTSWHFDSAFLWVPYSGYSYGDTADKNATQSYQVFSLQDSLGFNSMYTAATDKAINNSSPLSQPTTVNIYHLQDSVKVNGVNKAPAMRIKLYLNSVIGQINSALEATDDSANQLTSFPLFFKGICVRPTDIRSKASLLPYFRLNGNAVYNQASIQLYYHRAGVTVTDPLEFYFYQSACAHYTRINRNYRTYPINNFYRSTQANDQYLALQDMPGAGIDVKISGLKNLLPTNALINKAQLQLSVVGGVNTQKYQTPGQIFVYGVANGSYPSGYNSGVEYYIEDRKPIGSSSPYVILDGGSHSFNYGSTTINTFTLGIPREIMSSIKAGNDTLHLHLTGAQLFYGANRMIMAGGAHPDNRYRTKLIVVYSSLKR